LADCEKLLSHIAAYGISLAYSSALIADALMTRPSTCQAAKSDG
jgi:hypothetical protein